MKFGRWLTYFCGLVVVLILLGTKHQEKREAQQMDEANRQFDQLVEVAKQNTGPCSPYPIQLIQPPPHSTRMAVLVIGGKVADAGPYNDLSLEAREPVPGEYAVRVAYLPYQEPSYSELV